MNPTKSRSSSSRNRKRPSYRRGIAFIALNDEPDETDVEIMETLLSVVTLATTYNISEKQVATDVLAYRRRHRT